ncbi:TnsA-like heteromeric transposase endonuclease subunit [Nocardia xishanensis]|uniref:TnsA-like heteromeric transposase endonuclease subunit n=1 Tax=Nocardia xishanensis TaxID=238964 RepID=A0ABW7X6K0_9NOCA
MLDEALARLLFADFDLDVNHIVAQPFLLSAEVDDRPRKHIPDYMLFGSGLPTVVDVKPQSRLARAQFTFGWTRELVEQRGWRYQVWTEPTDTELANVRFLAGFRRYQLFDPQLLEQVRAADLDGVAFAEACRSFPDFSVPLVRSALLHLFWTQYFTVDLARPLQSSTVLWKRNCV